MRFVAEESNKMSKETIELFLSVNDPIEKILDEDIDEEDVDEEDGIDDETEGNNQVI